MTMQSPRSRAPETCARCILKPFLFYATGSADEVADLAALRQGFRILPQKSSIYREGESTHEYFTLYQGWAFRYKLLPDGRRQILSFLLPGESISYQLMRAERLRFSVQALTEVGLCVIDRRTLVRYVDDRPDLATRLDHLTARELAAADERLVDLGRRSAHERIAGFILQLHRRLQQRGGVEQSSFAFPLRQQHIADALGLTSVHVSRVMKDLKADAMVRLDGERLTILDEQMLGKLANDGDRSFDEQLH